MKETLKTAWWQIPLYSLAASFLSFHLKIRLGVRFAADTLPDGSVSINDTRWAILSGCVFLVLLLLGGLLFFRRMTRRAVFCSAAVMAAVNCIGSLTACFTQRTPLGAAFAIYFSELTDWSTVASEILHMFFPYPWLCAVLDWTAPFLLVFFGRRDAAQF